MVYGIYELTITDVKNMNKNINKNMNVKINMKMEIAKWVWSTYVFLSCFEYYIGKWSEMKKWNGGTNTETINRTNTTSY